MVKTNIEYKVVAAFVTQSETTEAIKEALSVIMKWNPIWKPKHFMVDKPPFLKALEVILSVQQGSRYVQCMQAKTINWCGLITGKKNTWLTNCLILCFRSSSDCAAIP